MKNKVKKPFNWKKELLSWGLIFIIALAAAFIITQFIIMKTKVISGSMIPELEIGDHVIGNRLAYLFSEPERGDVIIFEYPKSYTSVPWLCDNFQAVVCARSRWYTHVHLY